MVSRISLFSRLYSANSAEQTRLDRFSSDLQQAAKKVFNDVKGQEGRQRISWKTVAALSLTEKSSLLSSRVLQVAHGLSGSHPAAASLGGVSAGLGILLGGTVALGDGTTDLRRSFRLHDTEGKKQAAMQIGAGMVSVPASAFSLIQQITPGAMVGLSTIVGVFSSVGALLSLSIAGWRIYIAGSFRWHLNKILRTKGLTEQEKLFKAFTFLKEKIAPTRKEREEILAKVEKEHPTWGQSAKQDKVHQKILDLAEVKIRALERRTSRDAIDQLLLGVDKYLDLLKPSSKPSDKQLQEADALIKKVQQGNKWKILMAIVIAIASALALCAVIIGTFFSFGMLPLVLFAISAAIGLLTLLYPIIVFVLKGGDRTEAIRRMAIETNPLTLSSQIMIR